MLQGWCRRPCIQYIHALDLTLILYFLLIFEADRTSDSTETKSDKTRRESLLAVGSNASTVYPIGSRNCSTEVQHLHADVLLLKTSLCLFLCFLLQIIVFFRSFSNLFKYSAIHIWPYSKNAS